MRFSTAYIPRAMIAFKVFGRQKHRRLCITGFGRAMCTRLVLGIETSCDETGAAVMDERGLILGESLHSQKEVHLKWVAIM